MKAHLLLLIFSVQFAWSQSPLKQLEDSPRHHEWVTLKTPSKEVKSFLVYPEVAKKTPVVIVIHENRGLNDWARSMADQIAEMGYIALAPDFLSGTAPNGGGTTDYENSDAARTGIYSLDQNQIKATLDAAVTFAKEIPASNGKSVIIGFCWGGSQSFEFATASSDIEAAIVCYGTGPKDSESYENVQVPIYGFYGGNDNRVNATIPMSKAAMENNSARFEVTIYEGAGHGFFRAGEGPNASEANKKARAKGLKRLKEILAKI
ncbi:dienelactone hydrolase family protein [Flavobacteriaceae bacterium]|nr:dienelactone hydrolase family protein [Flavobacteriaceae bacterium]MDA9016197.1 dienelactone hydrolase family protein [Flavobacteriaceae bacterium]